MLVQKGKLSPFSLADATRTLLFLHHIRGGSFASYASSTSPALLSLSSRQRCHTRGTRSIMGGLLSKGVEYEADGVTVKNCLFCDIAASKPGLRQTAVAFEDDKVVVFAPLEPCALEHWLVVPRAHLRNASTLKFKDLPLLAYMKEIGTKVLAQKQPGKNPQDFRFCFHVEPFNSIAHLHLHCQILPFTSTFNSWKYKMGTRWCWSYDAVKERLEKGEGIP